MTTADGPVERALLRTLAIAVALAVALVAALIAVVAVLGSKSAVQCVNRILATRQDITALDNTALLAEANANLAFVTSINSVLVAAPGPAQQTAFLGFEKVVSQTAATFESSAATLAADQAYRKVHPLGAC